MTGPVNEQQGSQLSAMFDGELPAAECELLARRLGRDPQLKAQWARYALIGAAMRGEPTRLSVADRVAQALGSLPADSGQSGPGMSQAERPVRALLRRWTQPLVGAAVAAGVASLSILWLQGRVADDAALTAQAGAKPAGEVVLGDVDLPGARDTLVAATRVVSNGEPERYTVPAPARGVSTVAPASQFANYVVAHSEYAAPMNRRNVLSAIVASDAPLLPADDGAPVER